jgi:hypothetical protein
MGISAYQEVTEWSDDPLGLSNHTYLFDGKSNALAYAKFGDDEITVFKAPIRIDTRRRKFEKVKHSNLELFAKTMKVEESKHPNWKVLSDSGKTYIVELIGGNYHCNCAGYQYRGKCKHSEKIKNENCN